jgi:hypothetical protein
MKNSCNKYVILILTLAMVSCVTMKKTFEKERIEEIRKSNSSNLTEPLTEEKIKNLPEPIKNYLSLNNSRK